MNYLSRIFTIIIILFGLGAALCGQDSVEGMEMILQVGNPGAVNGLVFSPDGTLFASANQTKKGVKLWSVKGRLVALFENDRDLNMSSIAISSDNRYLALADFVSIKIWEIATGRLTVIKNDRNYRHRSFNYLIFHPDNRHIIAAVGERDMNFLPQTLAKSDFEGYLAKGDGTIKALLKANYRLEEGEYIVNSDLPESDYLKLFSFMTRQGFKFNPQPRNKNAAQLWSVDGAYKGDLAIHNRDIGKYIYHMNSSPDGSMFLTMGQDSQVKLWDMEGNLLTTVPGGSFIYNSDFSSNGKLFGWVSPTGLKVCNTKGVFLINLNQTQGIADLDIDKRLIAESSATASPGGQPRPIVRLKDFKNNLLKDIEGLMTYGTSLTLSPTSDKVISGAHDGSVNIVTAGSANVVLMVNDRADWITFTPDGYWDASNNGGRLVAMVKDFEVYGVDQFAVKFNRPDIILKRLDEKDETLLNHYYNQYRRRLRKMKIKEEDLTNELHVPEAKIIGTKQSDKKLMLSFRLKDSKYKLKSYNIYINDVPIFGSYGRELNLSEANIKEEIELTYGKNKIEISCINEKGSESFRTLTYASYDKRVKGNLYFIGFGVSNYKSGEINDLEYAHKDVLDLKNMFSGLKESYNKLYLHSFINEQVTAENIEKAKELLKGSSVDDTFVLFIAGHGMHDSDSEATYYFLTHETKLNNLSKSAANFELIEELLQGIPPRNKLFLMDTCESGEIDEEVQREYYETAGTRGLRARSIERGLKKMSKSSSKPKRLYLHERDRYIYNDLFRRSGAIVFSSSKGGEFSYEDEEFENGLFTEEILNGLGKGKADSNGDGLVSIDELKAYIIKAVAELSEELQHPTVDRDNIYQKFGFPLK